MAKINKVHNLIDLECCNKKIETFYAKWASSYNQDLANIYFAPHYISQLLINYLKQINTKANQLSLIDAGCGTGLVGSVLAKHNLKKIDGFDLSSNMINQAKKQNIYQELKANVDLTQVFRQYEKQSYDIVICCGVFTLGHVSASALQQLVYLCKPGGIILLSTRVDYYQNSQYQKIQDKLIQEKQLMLHHCIKDAPYTTESHAHYWLYQVSH